MGKIAQGPFGQFVGKAAGLVGQVYLGKNIIKAYQPKVYNPNTDMQKKARNRFKYLTGLWKLFRQPATFGLRHMRSNVGLNPFNLFTKINSPAVEFITDDWSIDFAKIQLSMGDLPAITSTQNPTSDDPNSIHVTWVNPDRENLPDSATLTLVFIDQEGEEEIPGSGCEMFNTNVSSSSYDVDFRFDHTGHTIHVYGICSNNMNGEGWPIGSTYIRRSPTFYFGKVTVS